VQVTGALGMSVEEDEARGSIGAVFFRREDVTAETLEKSVEIRRLLKFPAQQRRAQPSFTTNLGLSGDGPRSFANGLRRPGVRL